MGGRVDSIPESNRLPGQLLARAHEHMVSSLTSPAAGKSSPLQFSNAAAAETWCLYIPRRLVPVPDDRLEPVRGRVSKGF